MFGEVVLKALRVSLALAILAVVIGGSILRSSGYFIHDIYWLQEGLGGDYVTHLLMGGLLFTFFWLLFPKKGKLEILIYSFLLIALDELSQLFIPTREFLWMDFYMGMLGAFIASMVILAISRFLPKRISTKVESGQCGSP